MAKTRLGQVFLKDPSWAKRIVEALEFDQDSWVIEIGPGGGALTRFLIPLAEEKGLAPERVVLVEKDPYLAIKLKARWPEVRVLNTEAQRLSLKKIGEAPFAVIGNLPYYVSSQILINLLSQAELITNMVLMFQKEVAQRIAAQPGSRDFGRLSALTTPYFSTKVLGTIKGSLFAPRVDVDSQVIVFKRDLKQGAPADFERYSEFVNALFAQPRRTVENSLSIGLHVSKQELKDKVEGCGINGSLRPFQVTLKEILCLFRVLFLDHGINRGN